MAPSGGASGPARGGARSLGEHGHAAGPGRGGNRGPAGPCRGAEAVSAPRVGSRRFLRIRGERPGPAGRDAADRRSAAGWFTIDWPPDADASRRWASRASSDHVPGDSTSSVGGDDPVPTAPARRARMPEVPGYELLEELGRGGMGVVYQGPAGRLNRPCRPEDDPGGRVRRTETASQRFQAEAEAVARLQHPNIVQIHDIGETEGLTVLRAGVPRGRQPGRRLDGTPWPPQQAAALVQSPGPRHGRGTSAGIVHRDLKPANILMDRRRHAQDHRLRPGQAARLRQGCLTGTGASWARPATWPPSRPRAHAATSGPPPTSTPWGRSSTSC